MQTPSLHAEDLAAKLEFRNYEDTFFVLLIIKVTARGNGGAAPPDLNYASVKVRTYSNFLVTLKPGTRLPGVYTFFIHEI